MTGSRGSGAENPIIDPIATLIAAARSKGVRVAYGNWVNHRDGSTAGAPDAQRSDWGRNLPTTQIHGTPGWEVYESVKDAPGDWVLRKYRPDAFYGTRLDMLMRWNGMKTIVVTGVGLDTGLIPTLMTAHNLGYFRVTVSDAVRGGVDSGLDQLARTFLEKHGYHSSIIKTSQEVIDIWNAAPAATAGQ